MLKLCSAELLALHVYYFLILLNFIVVGLFFVPELLLLFEIHPSSLYFILLGAYSLLFMPNMKFPDLFMLVDITDKIDHVSFLVLLSIIASPIAFRVALNSSVFGYVNANLCSRSNF